MKEVLAPGSLPPGERIYAIGDVHGCLDHLNTLHAAIAADLHERPVNRATVLHVGDLVDRGPRSAGVLDLLLRGAPDQDVTSVVLLGNHEAMLLAACEPHPRRGALEHWLDNGGDATLESYGVAAHSSAAAIAAAIPEAHRSFLKRCPLRFLAGEYLFVHAGIRPGVPLDAQSPEDLLWIREPFLSATEDHRLVVVHGHTPTPEPVVRPNRIGIDTGACFGGPLTCLVLEGDRLRFLAA